jgi:zinc D-Ala-D-Ala carboxypeptidase
VLDRATWMLMVQTWQSRRLGSSAYPRPDELVTVPASEFWDPGRAAEMRQVERTTYAAYRRMIAAAAADPSLGLRTRPDGELDESEKFFKIVSAYRSREYQERLRRADPSSGRAGLARNSPHFTGRALDLYVGGYDPVSTKDDNRALQTQTRAYRWLVRHAESFGFRPYYYEPWHWEYVGR